MLIAIVLDKPLSEAYWGGPFLRACFFLRCEDQKRAPSLSYLYVVCDKKGSLLLGCDLGKAPD